MRLLSGQWQLLDGQQRITALRAAVAGLKVVNKRYKSVRITIAFNPVTEEFATLTPVIAKKAEWISDISELFNATSTYGGLSETLQRELSRISIYLLVKF